MMYIYNVYRASYANPQEADRNDCERAVDAAHGKRQRDGQLRAVAKEEDGLASPLRGMRHPRQAGFH